jgi:hypothetical protein
VLRKENQESTVNTREINAASVEIGKHGIDVISDERPEGMVEGRPKAIWPGACILVHIMKSPVDLFLGERQRERGWKRRATRVQLGDVKIPRADGGGAQKVQEEATEGFGFASMIRVGRAILLDDRDDIASFAASSEGVEEFAVFITFNSESDFCSGFPMADPLTDGNMETGNGEGAEPFF